VLAAVAKGQCHCCRLLVLEGEQCRLHWSADDGAAFSFRLERTLSPIFKSNAAQPQHALGFPEVTAAPGPSFPFPMSSSSPDGQPKDFAQQWCELVLEKAGSSGISQTRGFFGFLVRV